MPGPSTTAIPSQFVARQSILRYCIVLQTYLLSTRITKCKSNIFVAIYLDKIVHNSDHNVTIKCKRKEKELNATEHNYTNYEWIMTIPHASSQHSWCGSQLSTDIDNSCQPSSAARWRGGAGVPTINHINKNQNIWHNWFRYVRLARRIGTLLATSQWNISSVFVR